MKRQDFYFDLPPALIAQYPLAERSDSRLLVYRGEKGQYGHHVFSQLIDNLDSGDLLVLNNTMVIPARFFGRKESGGQVEFLVERILDNHTFLAHIKASKPPRAGMKIYLADKWEIQIIEKQDSLYHCHVEGDIHSMLKQIGHIPLPPYITRKDEQLDEQRYQTVFAQHKGSVAAPTAGLHFDEPLLQALKAKGVGIAYVTLHVGAGTFRPVRCEEIAAHQMHPEWCVVDEALCTAVNATKAAKKRVIAVGTTAVRSLESATVDGILMPYRCDTDIFIYPGYTFKICDGILTNFHLPESTLLMLVAAFIGHAEAMALYQEAISQKYRFFSYGDASLLLKKGSL